MEWKIHSLRSFPPADMFEDMWGDLAVTLEEFLFSESCPSPNQSLEEQQNDEVLDTRVSDVIDFFTNGGHTKISLRSHYIVSEISEILGRRRIDKFAHR